MSVLLVSAPWDAVALDLIKAGHAVTVFNRTPDRAEPLVRAGAKQAMTIAAACRGEAVFTMLANDSAVEAVVSSRASLQAQSTSRPAPPVLNWLTGSMPRTPRPGSALLRLPCLAVRKPRQPGASFCGRCGEACDHP